MLNATSAFLRATPLLTGFRRESLPSLVFALLLATVFAHIWFGGVPLLLGGPNATLAALAAFLAALYALLTAFRRERNSGGAATPIHKGYIKNLVRQYRIVIPVIAVSLLLLLWALAVYLFTDTLAWKRLGQIALGIGVLFAVYVSVNSLRRAALLALAIVAATFASAIYGLGVVAVGDPFLTLWLKLATVKEIVLNDVLLRGRTAGLAADSIAFSYQIVVAIPLALAAFLYNPFSLGKASGRVYSTALFIMLLLMIYILLVSSTRSAIWGSLSAALIVALPSARIPQVSRRLLLTIPAIVICITATLNPMFNTDDLYIQARNILAGRPEAVDLSSVIIANSAEFQALPLAPAPAPVIGRKFNLDHGVEYYFQFRAQDASGYGPPSETVTAIPDAQGIAWVLWPAPDNPEAVTGYQYRVRAKSELQYPPWRDFNPAFSTTGASSKFIKVEFYLGSKAGYYFQIRTENPFGYGPPTEAVTAIPDDQRNAPICWPAPANPEAVTGYQYRVRPKSESQYRPWRNFEPTLKPEIPSCLSALVAPVAAPQPAPTPDPAAPPNLPSAPSHFGNLDVASDPISYWQDGPYLVRTIAYLFKYREYIVQLRPQNADGFGEPSPAILVSSGEMGRIVLAWLNSGDADVTGYQFRLAIPGEGTWRSWRDFNKDSSDLAAVQMRSYISDVRLGISNRVADNSDPSAKSRPAMALTALRYSLDHPLGTGADYSPAPSHLSRGLSAKVKELVLKNTPHNQFLVILVYYGFPGLVLLILFYALVLRPLVKGGWHAVRRRDAATCLLLCGIAGAVTGYGINSLLHNAGPFVGGWEHFFIIGLAFSLQRITESGKPRHSEQSPSS